MDFKEAINIIEQRGDFNQYAKLRTVFEDKLQELDRSDYTERGLCYYYLLVSLLKAHLVYDTEECREFYTRMDIEFQKQEEKYKEERARFSGMEIADFYHLMERCYSSLEIVYEKKDFAESRKKSYERKMIFRKNAYWFEKKYGSWLEYELLQLTCLYGDSFVRWGITALAFSFVVAFLYFLIDLPVAEQHKMVSSLGGHWFDYIYFSIITLTSLGFGDFVPVTLAGKILTSIEAFFGFVMLGIFITLIQKKI